MEVGGNALEMSLRSLQGPAEWNTPLFHGGERVITDQL